MKRKKIRIRKGQKKEGKRNTDRGKERGQEKIDGNTRIRLRKGRKKENRMREEWGEIGEGQDEKYGKK